MNKFIKAAALVFIESGHSEFDSWSMARKLFYPPFHAACKASIIAQIERADTPYESGPYWYERITGEDI